MVRSSPNSRIRRILAVGGDVSLLSSGANLLTQAGYTTDLVVTVEQAIRRVNVARYHLVIVSSTFNCDEQLAISSRLKQATPSFPVLLLGPEHDTPETFLQAVAACLGLPRASTLSFT
jgi:DNA-binding NtrC family response regulator